jgi:predicted NAD/FAD-dependent oxidoreductase
MARLGVVGAGAAGAAATFVADDAMDVTVLEKSRGLCGRAATRRRGPLTYDYGANYLRSDDDRVRELVTETLATDGLVDVAGPVWTFDASDEVSPGRNSGGEKWSYRRGLTQVAKRLFGRTDAAVHRETRAETLRRDGERWAVVDADGVEWGPFDALLLTPPAPQTAALLRAADWDDPRREALARAAGDVPYRSVWTAVLHYEFELDRPYYALVDAEKSHDAVGWVSREECKPGHVPEGETLLVVQATPEWSAERHGDPPARNVADLAARAADLVGDGRLAEPDWADHQGWRYALPDAAADAEPLAAAEDAGIYCAGDWVVGEGRLHAALRCGLDVGERLRP